jgi:hypothetical protein
LSKAGFLNEKSEAVPNISVLLKGTTTGATTDEKGDYSLQVKDSSSVLTFSSIGYEPLEEKVGGRSTINITLKSAAAGNLADVVVVGYGTQKKVTVTGAVAQVKGTELQKSPAVNMSNSIAGRMPGVIATNSSGEPGYDGATLHIRGTNSLGDNSALVVIDGVPARAGGLDRLNPADIETMSVLKDAFCSNLWRPGLQMALYLSPLNVARAVSLNCLIVITRDGPSLLLFPKYSMP